MSDSERWCKVTNKKSERKRIRYKRQDEEKNRWINLQSECPHIMMPCRVQRIKRRLNIDLLDTRLMSEEWIDFQKDGWIYVKVLKPSDTVGIPESNKEAVYSALDLNNGWGDKVIFCKYQNGYH